MPSWQSWLVCPHQPPPGCHSGLPFNFHQDTDGTSLVAQRDEGCEECSSKIRAVGTKPCWLSLHVGSVLHRLSQAPTQHRLEKESKGEAPLRPVLFLTSERCRVSSAISCRGPAGPPSSITKAILEPCPMSHLRYHVEVLSFPQVNLCEAHQLFVCTRKDKPLVLGMFSTTDSRLLARQPRVVADHLNVFFCRQQTTQKTLEFLIHLDTGPSVTNFGTISSGSQEHVNVQKAPQATWQKETRTSL